MKIKPIAASSFDLIDPRVGGIQTRHTILDSRRRVWCRLDIGAHVGEWAQLTLPDEPKRYRRKASKL